MCTKTLARSDNKNKFFHCYNTIFRLKTFYSTNLFHRKQLVLIKLLQFMLIS